MLSPAIFPSSPATTESSVTTVSTLFGSGSSASGTGASEFTRPKFQFPNPKQEISIRACEHPRLYSPSEQIKKVCASIEKIERWARSSAGSKVSSNVRELESILTAVHDAATSAAPHPDHVMAMVDVHQALINLFAILPRNIFPFLLQTFSPFVDELCPRKGVSFSARFGCTLHDLRSSIRRGLQVLDTMVLGYTSEEVTKGGGTHVITKYLMKYIRLLLDRGRSLSIILIGEGVASASSKGSTAGTLQDAVIALMTNLEAMLQKESYRYLDAGLQQIFLVNNVSFMLQEMETSEIRYLLGDVWVFRYRDLLDEYVSWFIDISWESVMCCFQAKASKIPFFSSLPTLQRFNLEFERTYRTQKACKVENPLLRLDIREAVSKRLVQTYREHLENRQNKPAKVMKYTPEDLEELLSELFEG